MASAPPPKTLLFLQLSVLLLTFFTVNASELNLSPAEPPKPHDHHHQHHHNHHPIHPPVKAPIHPPVKAPVHPPVKAPVHPPVKAPAHPPVKAPISSPPFVRKLLAVEGVVYCKSCKYHGIDTFLNATPLAGSKVKLVCNNTKYKPVIATSITDKNGYFIINPKGVTTAAYHKCKVFLLSSPSATCNVQTNLHNGTTGATLKLSVKKPPVVLPDHHLVQYFSVGPFAYEPSKKYPCPK